MFLSIHNSHCSLLTDDFLSFMNIDGERDTVLAVSPTWINFKSSPVCTFCYSNKQNCKTDVTAKMQWENCLFFGPQVRVLSLSFPSSLFCSVEKPPHAHRDQLFHSESLLRWRAGHHHLPACQSGGGHHRNLVLREHALQNCAIFTGMWSFRHTVLDPIWCRSTHPCFHICYICLTQYQRGENTYWVVSHHI